MASRTGSWLPHSNGFPVFYLGDRNPSWSLPTLKPITESVPTMRPNRWQSSCLTVLLESTPSTPTRWLSGVTAGHVPLPPLSVKLPEASIVFRTQLWAGALQIRLPRQCICSILCIQVCFNLGQPITCLVQVFLCSFYSGGPSVVHSR